MLYAFGAPGQALIVAIVALTSITSMNAILIAGARTTYAAARDTAGSRVLGGWHVARGTPPRGDRRDGRCSRSRSSAFGAVHARRLLDDGRLPVARLLAVPDVERHRGARAAAPLSRRAAAVSRAVVSLACRSRSSRAARTCCTRAWPTCASAPSPEWPYWPPASCCSRLLRLRRQSCGAALQQHPIGPRASKSSGRNGGNSPTSATTLPGKRDRSRRCIAHGVVVAVAPIP